MTKNEAQTDIDLFNYMTDEKNFSKQWASKKTSNRIVQSVLAGASKSGSGRRGEPDLLYLNENRKLLILVENKNIIKFHESETRDKPKDYAVDGILHYLSFFTLKGALDTFPDTTRRFFKNFKIIGIAFSGEINDQLNHMIDTFIIQDDEVRDIKTHEILDETDYIALFETLDVELITSNISKSSREINNKLRNIDSQKRPVLLSALMICLYDKNNFTNDLKENYVSMEIKNIIRNIPDTIKDILREENVAKEKIDVLINELSFIKTDKDINDTDLLREILIELDNNVIPLFNKNTSYDIIGKFYEEFLRYAGITNVKAGIVLTPNHITKLFIDLIDIKINDIIFDPCCGTGAFLISGMNALIDAINNSNMRDKNSTIRNIKQDRLLGFEKNTTMYSLAISNMLFRGDGKSKIFNLDFFSDEAEKIIQQTKPTIGLANPPYGGKDNSKNPTKKEIQFLEKMLDSVSRFGIIIAPLSTYFKEDIIRNRILSKHTLKYVINMPNSLFQPNASSHTAIAVFETHLPHNNKEMVFYNLSDDGLVLSKNKGRTDTYNKWNGIKNDLLKKLNDLNKYADGINLVYKKIDTGDEWILQAHMKTDYSKITNNDFIKNIKKYIAFSIKLKLNLLYIDLDEITMSEILNKNNISASSILENDVVYPKNIIQLSSKKWHEFKVENLFDIAKGERLTKSDRVKGSTPLLTATGVNNGIACFINKDTYSRDKKIFSNKITLDMFFHAFYQSKEYFSDDNVHTLIPKERNMNIYSSLFILSILNFNQYKYAYGRQLRIHRLKKEQIKLPVDNKGNPDWQFMEKYIKSLPYSKNLENGN